MPDITISLTPAQATRVADAVGRLNGLRDQDQNLRPATEAEARQEVVDFLKSLVRKSERVAAEQAAREALVDLDVT